MPVTTASKLVVACVMALALLPSWAHAAPPSDCDTPRHAIDSLFAWQQPETSSARLAAKCLEAKGRGTAELEAAAKRVKALFDARALFVKVDELPDEPSYVDPKTGSARVVVHPELPQVVVMRQADGQWRWTADSINRVEELYGQQFSLLGDSLIEKMPKSLRGKFLGVEIWQYLALALLMLLALVVRKVIQVLVQTRIRRLVERYGAGWGAKLAASIDSPGATLVMAGMLAIAYPQLHLPINASLAVAFAVRLLSTVSVAWAAYRLVDVVSEALAIRAQRTDSRLDDQLVPLVRRTLKVVTVTVGALFVLQNMEVDVGSLLAGLGIGGLGFALAAKDTLSNFFGSVMIFTDKPFQIGDWIVVDGAEGIVEEVGFRSTRIRTFYNSLITLPNQNIANTKVDNYGARRYRRTVTTLNLTYDTSPEQLQAFCEGIRAIIQANPYSRKDYFEVHFAGFGAHSLDVMVYFFFEVAGWNDELRERHNVYLEILRLARSLGVSFAFPTQTLHLEQVAAPGAAREVPQPLPPERMGELVRAYGPGGAQSKAATPFIAGGFFDTRAAPPPEESVEERKSA